MASSKVRLRITADDIGVVSSIDKAVRELVEMNIINSLSVFVTGTCDKSWMLQYTRDVMIGLHLTFSYGSPLSILPFSSGLINAEGNFLMPRKPDQATTTSIKSSIGEHLSRFSTIPQSYLRQETLAQYDAFAENFGKAPDFINVHHDLDICENLKLVLLELFPTLPTRAALDKKDYFYLYDFLDGSESFQESEQRVQSLINDGIRKRFVENMDGEVVFHPAYCSDELQSFSTYSKMREREFSILSSEFVKAMLNGRESDTVENNSFSG